MDGHLIMWTIYDSPSDEPGWIVARAFAITPGGPVPTIQTLKNKNLESMRRLMQDMGLYCIGRQPGDEPQIVETWL